MSVKYGVFCEVVVFNEWFVYVEVYVDVWGEEVFGKIWVCWNVWVCFVFWVGIWIGFVVW